MDIANIGSNSGSPISNEAMKPQSGNNGAVQADNNLEQDAAMKPDSDSSVQSNANSVKTSTNIESGGGTLRTRSESFSAEVIAIKSNLITVKTALGQIISGKPETPIKLLVGQRLDFIQLIDSAGNLVLKPENRNMATELTRKQSINELLSSLGFKPSAENIKLVNILLDNGMALTKESIVKLNQALKLLGGESGGTAELNEPASGNIQKAIFLIANNMKANKESLSLLLNLSGGEKTTAAADGLLQQGQGNLFYGKLNSQIINLAEQLLSVADEALLSKNTASGPEQPVQRGNIISETLHPAVAELEADEINENNPRTIFSNASGAEQEVSAGKSANQSTGKSTDSDTQNAAQALSEAAQANGNVVRSAFNGRLSEFISSELPSLLNEIEGEFADNIEFGGEKLKGLISKLIADVNKLNPADVPKYIMGLKTTLHEIKTQLNKLVEQSAASTTEGEHAARQTERNTQRIADPVIPAKIENLIASADRIHSSIDFLAQIKNGYYFQLPLMINNQAVNSEIYIFKNQKKTTKNKNSISALVALDTANLGRLETYIQKTERSISCQFRTESKKTETMLRVALPELYESLTNLGYSMEACSFKEITEPFTIMDREGILNDTHIKTSNVTGSKEFFDCLI